MTPTENEELVAIQPKHLRLMKFHLSQYLKTLCEQAEANENLDTLCKQAEANEKVKAINEIGLLDYVIDTLLRADNFKVIETILRSEIKQLENELANRPIVWAIQHIETKTLCDRGYSVELYGSVEAAESVIRTDFGASEHQAVVYNGGELQ